jgi:3-dehydroquinate synthase
MTIKSFKGPYTANLDANIIQNPEILLAGQPAFLIDANVARLYYKSLKTIIEHPTTIIIEAKEENKTIQQIIPVIDHFVRQKIRREHTFVAIGGGIIQDITCFIASTMLRGIDWKFVPTTLLAQADSCIGSKSSINLGNYKNILGTFNPPKEIFIDVSFLETLEKKELHSGFGEILKVHAIDSMVAFDALSQDYDDLTTNPQILLKYIHKALEIKKQYIEVDEFDKGIRNIFNYGHSFGHAIESATHFGIPHGVAVSLGSDLANFIAYERGLITEEHFHRMHPVLEKNYSDYINLDIPIAEVLSALLKDKKNTATKLVLILPTGERCQIKRVEVLPDENFKNQCLKFFKGLNR